MIKILPYNSPKAFTHLNSGSELDFHQCVLAIQAKAGQLGSGIGTDRLPSDEVVRFKVSQHLGFPGKALEEVESPKLGMRDYTLWVNFFGLTGPSGVMPQHYSEWIIDRSRKKDQVFADFLDIFNHRLLSLYHRAWEKYHHAVQYQHRLANNSADPISRVLGVFAGGHDDIELYFSGLLASSNRSAQALRQILSQLAGCKVSVNEFRGQWLQLERSEQSRLGSTEAPEGQHARLGVSATLGSRVWDIGASVEVVFHACDQKQAIYLLSRDSFHPLLQKIQEAYLPSHMSVRWVLEARYGDLPLSKLGSKAVGLGAGCALAMNTQAMNQLARIPFGLH